MWANSLDIGMVGRGEWGYFCPKIKQPKETTYVDDQ